MRNAAFIAVVLGSGVQGQAVGQGTVVDTVISGAPIWTSSSAWRVGSTPAVLHGEQDGADHIIFSRIAGVFLTPGGEVVVGDGASRTVRVLRQDGSLVRSHGGEGDGPGEIRDLTRLWIDEAASIYVYDGRHRRVSVFRAGAPPVTIAMQGPGAFVTPYGRLANGSMVTGTPRLSTLGGEAGDMLHDTMTIWIGFREHEEVARLPNRSRIVFATATWASYPYLPLTVGPAVAVRDDAFVLGHGTSSELRHYDANGRLQRIIRWSPARRPVTGAVRQAVADQIVRSSRESERPDWRRFARDVPLPRDVPLFDRVALDETGTTWARTYRIDDDAAAQWTVFDSNGRWLGELTLPAGFDATAFGADYIAGIQRDALGVERAAILRLERMTP